MEEGSPRVDWVDRGRSIEKFEGSNSSARGGGEIALVSLGN